MTVEINLIVLQCIALQCIAMQCIALHCIALHCIALHCIALHLCLYSCSTDEWKACVPLQKKLGLMLDADNEFWLVSTCDS